jgi:hypothetical protein
VTRVKAIIMDFIPQSEKPAIHFCTIRRRRPTINHDASVNKVFHSLKFLDKLVSAMRKGQGLYLIQFYTQAVHEAFLIVGGESCKSNATFTRIGNFTTSSFKGI